MDRSDLTLGDDMTIAYSRIVCVGWMYPIHMTCAYLLVVTGVAAMVTRVVPQYKSWHATFGRAFMLIMYFTYASSLVIRTAGLSLAIFLFMVTKATAITVGWLAIAKHKALRHEELMKRVNIALKEHKGSTDNLTIEGLMAREKKVMESEKTTFRSRFFTYKSLHGVSMAYAWYTMAGRTFVTNPITAWEGCFTYPAFKTLEGEVEYLPREQPGFRSFGEELAFFFGIFFLGQFLIFGTGIVSSWRAAKKTREEAASASKSDDPNDADASINFVSAKRIDADESSSSPSATSSSGDDVIVVPAEHT